MRNVLGPLFRGATEGLELARQRKIQDEQRRRQATQDALNEEIQRLNMEIARANLGETQELRKRRNLLLDAQENLLEAQPGVMQTAQPATAPFAGPAPQTPQVRSPGAALGLPGLLPGMPGRVNRPPSPAPAPLMAGMPAGARAVLPAPQVQSELDAQGRPAQGSALQQTGLGKIMAQMAMLQGGDVGPGLAMQGIYPPPRPPAPLQWEDIPGVGRLPINATPGAQQEILRQQGRERDRQLITTIAKETYPDKAFKDLSLQERVDVFQQAGARGLSLEAAEVLTVIQTGMLPPRSTPERERFYGENIGSQIEDRKARANIALQGLRQRAPLVVQQIEESKARGARLRAQVDALISGQSGFTTWFEKMKAVRMANLTVSGAQDNYTAYLKVLRPFGGPPPEDDPLFEDLRQRVLDAQDDLEMVESAPFGAGTNPNPTPLTEERGAPGAGLKWDSSADIRANLHKLGPVAFVREGRKERFTDQQLDEMMEVEGVSKAKRDQALGRPVAGKNKGESDAYQQSRRR